MNAETRTVVQNVSSPKSTTTSSIKLSLMKNENTAIHAIITIVDPNTTINVSTVQLQTGY
jgi:hypothetical protein